VVGLDAVVITGSQRQSDSYWDNARGVGTAGATGALAPPPQCWNHGGDSIFHFRRRNIFPRFCTLFLQLPLFVVSLCCLQLHVATENFNKQKNTQADPTHKACLCHYKQDGKLLRVL